MNSDPKKLVEHYFRHEYGRQVALLVRTFGVRHLELVEDVVQSAMSKALQSWGRHGLPQDPTAWLYRASRNLAIDALRRSQTEHRIVAETGRASDIHDTASSNHAEHDFEVGDESLRMLFLCCHPDLPLESRIAFALKTVSGFSIDEIANALLITKANAEKRITRAKESLRSHGTEIADLGTDAMNARTESVMATIYLVFNEGYASNSAESHVRRDLCDEAIRLARMLTAQPEISNQSCAALLALMLMHAARFDARIATDGSIVLLEDQDREQWNWQAIREALHWMSYSTQCESVTRYHVEAAIAWEHCRAQRFEDVDWHRIVHLYEILAALFPGPMVQLNQAIAHCYAGSPEVGLAKLVAISQQDRIRLRPWWDCAMAEVYSKQGQTQNALSHWQDAYALATHPAQRDLIAAKIQRNI